MRELSGSREDLILIIPPAATAKMGDIDVLVIGIMLRQSSVQYEVAWCIEGDRKTAWVEECELTQSSRVTEVGFKSDVDVNADP